MNKCTINGIAETIGSGITPLRSNPVFWENPKYPWLKTEQLGEFQVFDTSEYISQAALDETNIKLWPPHTLSVAMYGEGKTRGNVSIIMREMATNQACCNIIVDEDVADFRYIYYWLKSNYNQLRVLSSGVRKNLNSDDIKGFPVFLPGLPPKQKELVDGLYAIDRKIQNNNRIIAELELMAKTIYDYWFMQFDFPNAEGKPYRASGGEMVWNEKLMRKIPKGWSDTTLNHFINQEKGGDWGEDQKTGNYTEQVICIRGADFPGLKGKQLLNAPTRYILKKNSCKILCSGDIIVEISGGSPTQSTGRVCFINKETLKRFKLPLITSNFCKAFSLKRHESQYWFYILWDKLYDAGVMFKYEGKTTGIKNLLFDLLSEDYHVVCPPDIVINNFNNIVSPMYEKIQKTNLENDELSNLRDWLLPMLMNGQVKVK